MLYNKLANSVVLVAEGSGYEHFTFPFFIFQFICPRNKCVLHVVKVNHRNKMFTLTNNIQHSYMYVHIL